MVLMQTSNRVTADQELLYQSAVVSPYMILLQNYATIGHHVHWNIKMMKYCQSIFCFKWHSFFHIAPGVPQGSVLIPHFFLII